MIKDFKNKGIKQFFKTGSKKGIQADHASKLNRQLTALDEAVMPEDMNVPGWGFHDLKGKLRGHWAVWVDKNWRLTFTFEKGDAVLVDYQDYH